jgi:hypothetical protein
VEVEKVVKVEDEEKLKEVEMKIKEEREKFE